MRNASFFLILLCCMLALCAHAQNPQAAAGQAQAAQGQAAEAAARQSAADGMRREAPYMQGNPHTLLPPSTGNDAQQTRKRIQALSKDQKDQLKRDSARLAQLTSELQQYLETANANVLSVEALKKAEEIEKLAKSVHRLMK